MGAAGLEWGWDGGGAGVRRGRAGAWVGAGPGADRGVKHPPAREEVSSYV